MKDEECKENQIMGSVNEKSLQIYAEQILDQTL